MNLPALPFQAIQEPDAFLNLFPHRFDFLYAEHPDPGDRPDWKTEDRHPLSDDCSKKVLIYMVSGLANKPTT